MSIACQDQASRVPTVERRPAIIGCGNLTRSDDGVGCEVIRQLQAGLDDAVRERCRLLDAGTAGVAVLYAARGASSLTIVDACRGLGASGDIFEVPGEAIDNPPPDGLNAHALRWDHAIYAARRILGEQFPSRVTVFLIEVQDTGLGLELSAPVSAAASQVARRIRRQLEGD